MNFFKRLFGQSTEKSSVVNKDEFIAECRINLSQKEDNRFYHQFQESREMVEYSNNKDYHKTIETADKVIELHPDWDLGYYYKGKALIALGQFDKAKQVWETGMKNSLINSTFCEALGEYYLKQKDYKNGMLWLLRCISIQIQNSRFIDCRPFLTFTYLLVAWGNNQHAKVLKDYSSRGYEGVIDFNSNGQQETKNLASELNRVGLSDIVYAALRRILYFDRSDEEKQLDSELMSAVLGDGDREKIKSLISKGANPNTNNGTNTVLMLAARYGHSDAVKQLLECGADPNIVNSGGDTALVWAETDKDNPQISEMLRAVTNKNHLKSIFEISRTAD